ncbi:MAG: class A beta-lactamase-related serine hydrolase [Streptococcaceae bacterium]|jgi:beta-lactamase class C|nr:class A beta-lactamase-related serine hydrolase [Streptococcaceae bacterium]
MQEIIKTKLRKIPWVYYVVLALFVVLVFFAFYLEANQPTKASLIKKQPKSKYLSVIPLRAVALSDIMSYKDVNLTQKKNLIAARGQLSIKKLDSAGDKPVFQLADGSYVLASSKKIASDITLTREKVSTTLYLTNSVNVLYNPFTTFDSDIYETIPGNQTLRAMSKASTHWGTYYEVSFDGGRTGWIDAKLVSTENPKMKTLQTTLLQKYADKKLSITVKQLDSKFTVAVNPDEKIYAASLWKLPILYWTQRQINAGKAALTDKLKYIGAVNDTSWGAFNPSGTGSMPKTADDKEYQLKDLIDLTAKESDNVASNMLAYYETNKFSEDFRKEIKKIAGTEWSYGNRDATGEMVVGTIIALYNEGGVGFNALFDTSYDKSRIEAGVPDNVKVAHKIGVADEENNDAAIVFANEPYVIVIMTTGEQPDSLLTEISQTVYEALK